MKTLEEIKDEWAKKHSYKNYKEFMDLTKQCDASQVFIMDGVVNEVAKRYAKEVAREALKNASDYYDACSMVGQVNIKLILNKTNIPEL